MTTRSRWIAWRSVLVGTVAVIVVCGLTPFNDYVVANTYLVGSYLPVAVAIFLFLTVVLVNAPLHRFLPRYALASGELAVILAMMLVACSVPSSGLMRVFIPMLVAPFHLGATDEQFWRAFTALELPSWLFPVEPTEAGRNSPVATAFYGRLQEGMAVPYRAWVVPLLGWGVFLLGLFATLIALMVLVRRQWADNERLPFPIVQLQLALIEPPRPGRALNDLFRSTWFWIALGTVFVVQSLSALHLYFPRTVPEIPLTFDLSGVLKEEPWVHLAPTVKSATIFFTFIGITYFIQSRVSFSLWTIFLITQLVNVQQRMMHREITPAAWMDQHLGASIAFIMGFLWIGRHYWWAILRQSIAGASPGEHRGDYLSNRVGLLVVLAGVVIMFTWLVSFGVQIWVALAAIAFILMSQLIVARVVSETGIPFFRAHGMFQQVYMNLPPALFSGRDIFFAQQMTLMGPLITREALAPFALHALQIHEQTRPPPRHRYGLVALLCWALAIGFVVSAGSSLWTYYSYAAPLTDREQPQLNKWGTEDVPRMFVVNPVKQHADGRFPQTPHNSWLHTGVGAGVMAALQFGALRWTSWPFMPVGYLISMTWYAQMAWFSILVGWLAKVLIVKYGGARLFQTARPLFVGIIFGEALAAGVWLLITIGLAQAGYDYQVVRFLPQ